MMKKRSFLMLLMPSILLMGLFSGCGAGGAGNDPAPSPTPTSTAALINLSASPVTVKSDGSTSTAITVTALDASNASLSGVVVTMSADTGVLGASTVTTNATTPATVSFYSPGNPVNRTATIEAVSGSATPGSIPIQIVGSTITLNSSATSLPLDGTSSITLTVTAKDAGGNIVQNTAVAITKSGSGDVTITPETGTTNSSGTFTTTVKGAVAGSVTLTATALGQPATKDITVTAVGANFAIDQQKLNGVVIANNATTPMKIGDALEVQVNAPAGTTRVTFATTIGTWDGGARQDVTKAVVSGKATATLTTTQSGVAGVQVYDTDDANKKDTRTIAMSSGAAPFRIILQASPTNVPVSVGTTTGSSTLIATVYDNATNPISGSPVLFSIINPTSGGETVLPVVVSTAETTTGGLSLGQANAAFTSGSMASGAGGIQIRASVVGTNVATNTVPSGNDANVIIGGVAGSIAFGQATVISELNKATYSWPMSILVADSAGAAVANADVSLSVWPIAWSTGELAACTIDPDNAANQGTFWNEDRNENLFLDATPAPAEDGARVYYTDKTKTIYIPGGTPDGFITPTNSASGTVPSKVTTDANGVAAFNLNYPKQSAIWTIVRLRAATKVLGSETRGELNLRLPATQGDVNPCILGRSPYKF